MSLSTYLPVYLLSMLQMTFHNTAPLASAFGSGVTPRTTGEGAWGQDSKDIFFNFHR